MEIKLNISKKGKKITQKELEIISDFIKEKDPSFKVIIYERESPQKGIHDIDFIFEIDNFKEFLSESISFISKLSNIEKPKLKGNWYTIFIGNFGLSFYDNKNFRGINVKF